MITQKPVMRQGLDGIIGCPVGFGRGALPYLTTTVSVNFQVPFSPPAHGRL